MRNALQKSAIDVHQLVKVEIKLEFTTFEKFPDAVRDTRGEPFLCDVAIVRKDGVTYSASRVGHCEAHNAGKEMRSTHAG